MSDYERAVATLVQQRAGSGTPSGRGGRVPASRSGLPRVAEKQIVLVGHRAAGKSRALPLIAALLNRDAVDLDRMIEARAGRSLRNWFAADVGSFRAAEREAFLSLEDGLVVAVGGGFWAHHPELLTQALVVEIPVSFRTYRERLLTDTTRPRLTPEVSLEEELRNVYRAREFIHRAQPRSSLGELIAAAEAQ